MKRILVTGIGGYAGSRIARYLQARGYEVTGLARRMMNTESGSFVVAAHDLSMPMHWECHFDVIVHAAGAHPGNPLEQMKKDNIDAMDNLISFAKENNIRRIINLSTTSIYGEVSTSEINEDTDIINPDPYGMTKYMAEMLLENCEDIEGCSLRIPGILGAGAWRSWIPSTVRRIYKGEPVIIYSPDFRCNNFVHVEDLSRFISILVESKTVDPVFLLGMEKRLSIRDCVDTILDAAGVDVTVLIGTQKKKPYALDVRRAIAKGFCSHDPQWAIRDCVPRHQSCQF